MGLALLAVLGLAWWLHRDGLLVPNLVRLGGTAALGLLAFRLLTTGRVVMALVAAAAAFAWFVWHKREPRALAQAARLLGVASDAPADVVWAAWRQAMQTAHPDAGGSAEAAQALTAARDLLVAAAEKRRVSGD
ncbi:MAG: hypothetical protein WCO11_03400 [Sphingomonadales bacterium]|jgi:hypothetical protein